MLVRLVEIARTDELASRVVLQRVLPGLLAVVRRRRRPGRDGSFEELIGAAWLAIRSCRTDRRPPHVAANLVRDAAYRAFIAPGRRLSATEVSVDPRTLEETPATTVLSPCEELAAAARRRPRRRRAEPTTSTWSATSSGPAPRRPSPPSAP